MDQFEGVLIEEEKGCQIVKLPINSSKQNMQNKKCDYKTLAIMTLYSYMTPNEITLEQGYEELYRFAYRNKIEKDMDEIEELSNNKRDTIIRNIKKLTKLNSGLITAVNSPKGIIYYINYRGEKGGDFVTIEEDILRLLVNTTNSSVIKVYILLKYLCRKGSREIHRAYIAEQIGLSTNRNSLNRISDMTYVLEQIGLIKKKVKYKTIILENGNEHFTQATEYELCTYEEYKQKRNNYKNKKI